MEEKPNEVHVFGKLGRNRYGSAERRVLVLTLQNPVNGVEHLTVRECDLLAMREMATCKEEHKEHVSKMIRQWFDENEDSVFVKGEQHAEDTSSAHSGSGDGV
jgi:hypothetical protein